MELTFFQNLKNKTVVLGGDHHARGIVTVIHQHLADLGGTVEVVPYDEDCFDYIDQSKLVAESVNKSPTTHCGIVGCKNGFGVTTVCNKYPHIFATRCDTAEQADGARKVNYCNVLTFGAVFVTEEEIKKIVDSWLHTEFEMSEKNLDRLDRLFKMKTL